jgi:1-acyl-sn-glycerol-3-phosphate acyltransferase
MQKLLTCLFVAYFFVSSAFLFCINAMIGLVTGAFDRNHRITHMYSCAWAFHYMLLSPFWRVKFEGRELIDPKKTYVLISNHQSYFDIFVLYGLFRFYKWVSREEIFDTPFIGANMYLNQYVKLVRGKMSSIKEMLKTCKQWLNRGVSIMIFPEGTRSETGEIGSFRDGAFRMAVECGVPVVPIVIDGTFELFPKRTRLINFMAPVRVKILPPVDSSEFKGNAAGYRDYVHSLMQLTLAEMRKQPASGALVSS